MLTVLPWFLEKVGGGGGGVSVYPLSCLLLASPSETAAPSLPCGQLVSPTPNEGESTVSNHLLFHQACASSSSPTWYIWCQFHLSIYFLLEVFVQKNANFSPKALTKERSMPSSKYCIYLVWSVHIKPKFKAFLPSLAWVYWACWIQHSRPSSKQQFETIQLTTGF